MAGSEQCSNGKILKVAWRNEQRMGESDIYQLAGIHPGVARLEDGGDVLMVDLVGAAVKLDTNFIIKRLLEKATVKATEFNAILCS